MAALHPESGLVAEVPAESCSGQYAHLRVHLVECGAGLLSAFVVSGVFSDQSCIDHRPRVEFETAAECYVVTEISRNVNSVAERVLLFVVIAVVQAQVDPPVPQDEVQGPLQVGHAVHDADVAAGQDSVRWASPLDEGEKVEKPTSILYLNDSFYGEIPVAVLQPHDKVYHASFRPIPEINPSVSSRKYMERWCPLFSEWRLDETVARETDVLAIIDKDVSDLQTGRNTVVCSSDIHIFPFCALPALSCCRRTP